MFTGIITDIGRVIALTPLEQGIKLRIATSYDVATIDIGASVACNGICLTVIDKSPVAEQNTAWFEVSAWEETLCCTTLSTWDVGARINLERALKFGDELGGHLVTGHIDGVAHILSCREEGDARRIQLKVPADLAPFISIKGSVTLDGVSLTVNQVKNCQFDVLLIDHTMKVTIWDEKKAGDRVNIEVDRLARMVARLLETSSQSQIMNG